VAVAVAVCLAPVYFKKVSHVGARVVGLMAVAARLEQMVLHKMRICGLSPPLPMAHLLGSMTPLVRLLVPVVVESYMTAIRLTAGKLFTVAVVVGAQFMELLVA
jgi:hypothetical protein